MTIGKPERVTQGRIIALFRDQLGYSFLGSKQDSVENSNIVVALLTAFLRRSGYSDPQISRAIQHLVAVAHNPNRGLYENNKMFYGHLRFGVQVKDDAGQPTETVHVIDWKNPHNNDFQIAEEVSLRGDNTRRPDLVLYVNGIAIGVIELKGSHISVGDGIRQLLSNQQKSFHDWFFSTVQFVFAGNDSEGLQYGTILTEEKYFLKWKEDETENEGYKIDKYLAKMCAKDRLIDLLRDFIVFDGGTKKLPRVHQYFGVKAAQRHVDESKGGIIWHTQGSGKSIVMVLLARWILENKPNARVLIVTDRDELDKQIEDVFVGVGEKIKKTTSGAELLSLLGQATPRLICSLVHKFGRRDVDDFSAFIKEIEDQPCPAVGDLFVFVDECHRTQSGRLHRTMKAMLPKAVFIGFTGTPLLRRDKQTTHEVFGGYIHTYKFKEAVDDKVVLDLVYEARDIEQNLGSQDKIDQWFDAKTKGLNDWQKAALREQWGTMQNVLSSRSRMDRVVEDIVFDFSVKRRLNDQRGNAILVASSIYEACKYYELFQKTELRGKSALVTSYNPNASDVTLEETGANTETSKQFIYTTYTELLKDVEPKPGKSPTEVYEDNAKAMFKKSPARMKLLIVVDKLLTGFDAPPCTYLYIDKSMQDHGLFQAICRTNRLDGEDKDFGYVVDYKELFGKVTNAINVYTSELDVPDDGVTPEVLLEDRLTKGRKQLETALEAMALLCEPVEPPKGELEHIKYFCGNTELETDLKEHEPQRIALYKGTATLVRSFANISDDLGSAGYSQAQIDDTKKTLERYIKLREIIRLASGETIDLKAYEADMRHLIDCYIEAKEPQKISAFDDIGLLAVIEMNGIDAAVDQMPNGIKKDRRAVAETIANNVRSKIIKEHLNDPAFYDRMSLLLAEILDNLRAKRIEYAEFLKKVAALVSDVQTGHDGRTPEVLVRNPAMRALYNNLLDDGLADGGVDEQALALAEELDKRIRAEHPADWLGVQTREEEVKAIIYDVIKDVAEVNRLFPIVANQQEYR